MQAGLISGPELGHCAVLLAVILKAPEPQTPFTSSWLQGARLEGSRLFQLGLPGASGEPVRWQEAPFTPTPLGAKPSMVIVSASSGPGSLGMQVE